MKNVMTFVLLALSLASAACVADDTSSTTSALGGQPCGTPNNCYIAGAAFTVVRYDPVIEQNVSYPPLAGEARSTNEQICWSACGAVTPNQKNHTGCGVQDPGPNRGNNFYAQCEYAP